MKIHLNNNNNFKDLVKSSRVEAILSPKCPSMKEQDLKMVFNNTEIWCKIVNIKKCRLDELSEKELNRLGFLYPQLSFTYEGKPVDQQKLYYYIEFIYINNLDFYWVLNEEYLE